MPRPRKRGRPKRRGPKPGPIKWTIEELAALADIVETALQALDGTWADRGNLKPIPKAEWVQKRPKRISAKRIADWIKAHETDYEWLKEKNYPSADQLRQILTTYRIDLVELNNARWKILLEDGEN
jgi:hypothetical protein